MIKATFYVEQKPITPIHFEELLSRRFEGWTHHSGTGCWQGVQEPSQTYTVIFEEYPEYKFDLKYLSDYLKCELTQESVLVTIETVEVL